MKQIKKSWESYEKILGKKLSNYSEENFACCYNNQIFEIKIIILVSKT